MRSVCDCYHDIAWDASGERGALSKWLNSLDKKKQCSLDIGKKLSTYCSFTFFSDSMLQKGTLRLPFI